MTALSAREMALALQRGETSAVALAQAALARITETNEAWRVFISVTAEGALEAAEASDRRRAKGETLGPLDGIPVAVKDNIDIAGLPTTNGARPPELVPAAADAHVVQKLRGAGAVLLGKANMDEGALGATADNPFWGRCENPAHPGVTPGGSSGGSAASVSGGMTAMALGTDTLGSVRIPAAYGGIWGLKPTAGLVSRRGLSPLSWTLDAIGPLGRSAEDLGDALAAIAGPDTLDPDGVAAPPAWRATPERVALNGTVLGVPTALRGIDCEESVRAAFGELVARAQRAGATVREVEVAGWSPTRARRDGLLALEAETAHRLGARLDSRESGHSEHFRMMIAFGRDTSAEKLAGAYRRLTLLRAATLRALKGVDALLLPTAPQAPFPHGAPAPVSQADLTALASIAGCPAVAFPFQGGKMRPAASAQLVGTPFGEGRLLGLARALAAA